MLEDSQANSQGQRRTGKGAGKPLERASGYPPTPAGGTTADEALRERTAYAYALGPGRPRPAEEATRWLKPSRRLALSGIASFSQPTRYGGAELGCKSVPWRRFVAPATDQEAILKNTHTVLRSDALRLNDRNVPQVYPLHAVQRH